MQYRHEWKHMINHSDYFEIQRRLAAVMKHDDHAFGDGRYFVRSLYFDDIRDKALMDKLNGIDKREKFRLRYYNNDMSSIQLEKKSKIKNLYNKQRKQISFEQALSITNGGIGWLKDNADPLFLDFYIKLTGMRLRPKTIVEYTREAYIYGPGNVRVTLDSDIRTGVHGIDFFNPDCITVPIEENMFVLEVKYDNFLPDIIRSVIQLKDRKSTAYSKYAACRLYG